MLVEILMKNGFCSRLAEVSFTFLLCPFKIVSKRSNQTKGLSHELSCNRLRWVKILMALENLLPPHHDMKFKQYSESIKYIKRCVEV